MSLSFLVLASWIASVLAGSSQMELTNKSSEFFITTPSTTTVVIGLRPTNSNFSHTYIGQFQCVTRVGFELVWVINGISADNIRDTPGFEQVNYELIPVQDSGNTLSILNIPATTQLNGTIVTCTAVYNQSIEAHSQPVYLIVTAEADSTEAVTNSTMKPVTTTNADSTEAVTNSTMTPVTTTNGLHDSTKVPVNKENSASLQLRNSKGLVIGIGAFAAVVLVIVIVTALVLVGMIVISRRGRHKRLQARSGPRENNIYWSATNAQALPHNNDYVRETENLKDDRR